MKECDSDDEEQEEGSRTVEDSNVLQISALTYMVAVFKSAETFDTLSSTPSSSSKRDTDNRQISSSSSSSSRNNSSSGRREEHSGASGRKSKNVDQGDEDSSDSSSSGSDDEDDHNNSNHTNKEADEKDEKDVEEEVFVARVGPSMPSSSQLASAQAAAEVRRADYLLVIRVVAVSY